MKEENECATSQVTGTLLLVTITVILAMLLLLCIHIPDLDWEYTDPPVVFKITSINSPKPTYDSQIFLRNIVKEDFCNKELSAKIYCNDELLPCTIITINNYDFISTAHYGVKNLYGKGAEGTIWNYNQLVRIDLSNGFIHPGDIIRVDFIKTRKGNIISRDSMEA